MVGFLIGARLAKQMTVEMFHEMQMAGLVALVTYYAETEKEKQSSLDSAGLVSEKLCSYGNDLTNCDFRPDVLTD